MSDARLWSTSAASNNSASPDGFPEAMAPSGVNNSAREVMAAIARWIADTTVPITTGGTSTAFTATLSQTVSSVATPLAALIKLHTASGAAPTLALDGTTAKTMKYADGTAIAANDLPSGSVLLIVYDGTDYLVLTVPSKALTSATGIAQGTHTIWVPASAMISRTTNGAASGTSESTTNKVMTKSLDFDQTTQEFAQFSIQFPKSWNEGTVTFAPVWTAASGTGGVVWALQGVALSDDDAIDTAYGTEQTSTDTLIATGDIHVGPTSAAITIAGTPAAGDWVSFQIKRNVADASDTLTADARLLGIRLFFTINAADDT